MLGANLGLLLYGEVSVMNPEDSDRYRSSMSCSLESVCFGLLIVRTSSNVSAM